MAELAAYSYDETGDTVVDYSGNGNHFSIAGSDTTRVTGHTGGGLSCDNVGTPAQLPPIGLTPQRTVMCWLRNPPDSAWPIWWRYAPLDSGAWGIVRLGGAIGVRARNAAGDPPAMASVPWPSDGQPHHVLGSYDGAALRLFLDGVLVATTPYAGPLRTDTDPPRLHDAWGNVVATAYQDDLRILDDAVVDPAVAVVYMNTPVDAVTPHEATAQLDLTLDLSAAAVAAHEAQAEVPLVLDVQAAALAAHEGQAALPLTLGIGAVAETEHEAQASLDLSLGIAGFGPAVPHEAQAEVALTLGLSAVASNNERPVVPDPIGWPLADRLADCLCTILTAEDPTNCCCVVGGGSVPWDDCTDKGQAWVRIVSQYATDSFPTPASRPGPCGGHAGWVVLLELGVLRCAPTVDGHGRPPSCAETSAAGHRAAMDKHRMLRALMCCDWRRDPSTPSAEEADMIVDAWTPVSEGDCIGSTWLVRVSSDACVCNG